jgi:glycosyltransferase involved in cell wall biosynthesis
MVEGYRLLGWDVAIGANNFQIPASCYDVIHYQWPEEYTEWRIPREPEIDEIEQILVSWRSKAINIFSVNNLYPHNGIGNQLYHKLYSLFYEQSHLVTHFSEASLRSVLAEYPAARNARHIVHSPPNYAMSLSRQKERGSRRAKMNIKPQEFVILVIGRLRSWPEIALLRRAFDMAKIPSKRLLMAGKLDLVQGAYWHNRLKKIGWRYWLARRHAFVDERYIPETELSIFLDSSDVVIVPRLFGLSSAIPLLAMTFGRMVIAPDCGAYREYFSGTRNLLYVAGDAKSLASRLEEASASDTESIGRENSAISAQWRWDRICGDCLRATGVIEQQSSAAL